MELRALRQGRRFASAAVSLSAIALVMARIRGPAVGGEGNGVGAIAGVAFLVSLVAFVILWRKEHAQAEAAFALRERQQLAALRLEIELARRKAARAASTESGGEPDAPHGPAVRL